MTTSGTTMTAQLSARAKRYEAAAKRASKSGRHKAFAQHTADGCLLRAAIEEINRGRQRADKAERGSDGEA